MDTNLTNEEIAEHTPRFRMLLVGRSGVGKSSLANRVFGPADFSFTQEFSGSTREEAYIDQELVSDQNQFIVLHDSKGFEDRDHTNFDHAARFLMERRRKPLLKDRLHVIWLCVETPRAGGRVLEEGDKKLLALAHELDTPVIVVFTKYDLLEWSKELELEEEVEWEEREDLEKLRETSRMNAANAFAASVYSVSRSAAALKIPAPPCVNVSVAQGYEDSVVTLVKMTGKLVQERLKGDAWVVWAAAQQVDIPVPAIIIL